VIPPLRPEWGDETRGGGLRQTLLCGFCRSWEDTASAAAL
jgi:hypothetical protein